jgi:hypothetical protein
MYSPACSGSRRSRRISSGPDRPWHRLSSSASRTVTISSLSSRPAPAYVPPAGGRSIPDTGSVTIALHDAGAAKVAVVVLGRHFDRSFGSGETYYQQAKARRFTWDACCLEIDEA